MLRQISVYVHAVATTPAEPLDHVALTPCYRPGQAGFQRRRPSPLNRRVGFRITLFEACSAFTRVTACTLAKSPKATLYTGVLQPLRYLHDRSDCYRLERPLAGWESHPLKIHAFPRRTEICGLRLEKVSLVEVHSVTLGPPCLG